MMPDFAQFFEQALREEGVEARVSQDDDPLKNHFHVTKSMGNKKLSYTTTINTKINTSNDEIRKEIVHSAKKISKEFEEYLIDTFEWGNDRQVAVSVYEGGWAMCKHCSNKVNVPEFKEMWFSESAELSTPQPVPLNKESFLNKLNEDSRLLLRMYLIGLLRKSCSDDCPNQKHNTKNKTHAYMKEYKQKI